MSECKHEQVVVDPERNIVCRDCGITVQYQGDCPHANIKILPGDEEGEEEYMCKDCGLTGDSEEDIRGEGTIEAAIEAEQEAETAAKVRQFNEIRKSLAETPEELFRAMDEKMFRQIMNGYITVKLRPCPQMIGYYVLTVQDRDVALVPDPEEGSRFIAAIFLKAAKTIPMLRDLDKRALVQTNGHIKIVQ